MESVEFNTVEVVYAEPAREVLRSVRVPAGSSVRQVLELSGILGEIGGAPDTRPVGIFGRLVTLDTPVSDSDRVELYRALSADPKQVRRRLAGAGKSMEKRGIDG